MRDVLFIKTSSLGDVIHHMPALTDARRHLPDARFAWLVEEAFAPLVRLHPAAGEVIAVANRRWRKTPSEWPEAFRFLRMLRGRRFDEIIDTQGLLKSAVLAKAARGRRHGYDTHSIKEPLASYAYDVAHAVDGSAHAVARNRMLTARALGYEPRGAPDYGLERGRIAAPADAPYAVLLHATAWGAKQWPVAQWQK